MNRTQLLQKTYLILFLFAPYFFSQTLWAQVTHSDLITIKVKIPRLDVDPYHRPYLAVWLETPKRQGVASLAVWYEKEDWLKDMRQWWRKLGRDNPEAYAAVTGATPKPGKHVIRWNGTDATGKRLPAGEYYLLFEVAREAGGRDFIRQKIKLGQAQQQRYTLKGDIELGEVLIEIKGE